MTKDKSIMAMSERK